MVAVVMFGSVLLACWPKPDVSKKPLDETPSRTSMRVELNEQIWFGLVPIGLLLILFDMFTGTLLVACGPAAWWFARRGKAQALGRARRDALPESLDLMAIAVASGLTVASAIKIVSEEGPSPVRPAFASIR